MVYIKFFPQHYWYCSLFCLIELTASVNNFVSRQSQCTRWRRKSKEGKTKRRSQNLISLSLRKNPSRNHRRKRLRLTSSLWRALGRWPQFWRLKETCCILLIVFVRLESMEEILLLRLLVVTQRPETALFFFFWSLILGTICRCSSFTHTTHTLYLTRNCNLYTYAYRVLNWWTRLPLMIHRCLRLQKEIWENRGHMQLVLFFERRKLVR